MHAGFRISVDSEYGDGDRNGEPAESPAGCLIMAALIGALGLVVLIILVVAASPG